ncbi:MAG: hypothetical protein ACO1SV_13860 [Fimbriimonas sp.]
MNPNGFHFGMSFGRQEPELASLYDWIDSGMSQTHYGRDWGIWGGVTGGLCGLAGSSIGITVGAMGIDPGTNPAVLIAPFTVALLGSGLLGLYFLRRQTPAQRAARKAMADARNFTWQLVSARWQGNLKGLIGEDRALALNAGAAAYMRAKQALKSSAWQAVAPDTEYAATRERTAVALDVAMARLVTMIGQGASGSAPEVRNLTADIAETAEEAVQTAQRLATDAGHPGDASENLRQVLSEMRLLNSAQDEYDRLRDRSH